MLEDTKNISGWVKLMAWVLTAIIAFSIWALAVLLVGCDNEKPETPNDVVFEIDPNSELVRSLNLLYDPNFYSTYKIVSLQFNYPDVNSLNEAASALRSYFRPGGFQGLAAKEVIDIEVVIGDETHTATFEDFFEWMGFKR